MVSLHSVCDCSAVGLRFLHLPAEISAIAAADCAYDFLCLYALGTDAKLVDVDGEQSSPVHHEL